MDSSVEITDDSRDKTINLDDSDTSDESFPRNPRGGRKLDATIELDSTNDDTLGENGNATENNHFVTASTTQLLETPHVTSTPNPKCFANSSQNTAVFGEVQDEFFEGEGDESSVAKTDTDSAIKVDKDSVNSSSGSENVESQDTTEGEDSDLEDNDDDEDNSRGGKIDWDSLDLPSTCSVLRTENGARVFLVGTAHFSRESQNDVTRVIEAVKPDVVMLELCRSRVQILLLDEQRLLSESQSLTVSGMSQVLKEQGTAQGLMYLLLQSMAAHITKSLGMAPGGEFRAAAVAAKNIPGCSVFLGDRPIQTTLKRAMAALSAFQKLKIGLNVLFSNSTITQEDVEKCKNRDLLESLLEEMAGSYPEFSKVFVDERDVYLAHSLYQSADGPVANGSKTEPRVVVGVVGIGHCSGIEKHWGRVTPADVAKVVEIPQQSTASRIIHAGLKISFCGLLAYGAYKLVVKLK